MKGAALVLWLSVPAAAAFPPCQVGERRFEIPAELCERANFAHRVFQRLLSAAGFSEREIRFEIEPIYENEFTYDVDDAGRLVLLGLADLEDYGANEAVLVGAFGHELGHAVQHRAGWVEPIGSGQWRYPFTLKRTEAHADLVGGQIAARAGYGPDFFLAGREAKFGCNSIALGTRYSDYPSDQDRWFNVAAYQTTLNGMLGFPVVSPAALSAEGALRPSQLVPMTVRESYLRALRGLGSPVDAPDKLETILDDFIEPMGARTNAARACGHPDDYPRIFAGIRNRLQGAINGELDAGQLPGR